MVPSNIEKPVQTQCVVSGVLSFVLYLSRVAGIAPLKFEKTRGGWCVRVSWFFCFYSYVLLIIYWTMTVMYYFGKGDEIGDDRASWGAYNDVMRFMSGICMIISMVVSATIVRTGLSRMCSMINCLSQLTLINEKMDHYYNSLPINTRSLWIFICTLLLFGYVTNGLDYAIYLYDMALVDKVGVLSCSLLGQYLYCLVVHLYAIQFAIIIMIVVSTLQRVNDSLQMLLHEIRNESSKSASSITRHVLARQGMEDNNNEINMVNRIPRFVTSVVDLVPVIGTEGSSRADKVRHLSIIYCSLCDIVQQLNISNGSALVMTLLFSFMYMITTPYSMFNVLFTSGSEVRFTKCIMIFVYFMFALIVLATAVEPCHRTNEQLLLTKELINNMLRFTGSEDKALRYELKLFKRHILLNPVSISPWQLMAFNRTTLVMVVSAVVTKITVMMYL